MFVDQISANVTVQCGKREVDRVEIKLNFIPCRSLNRILIYSNYKILKKFNKILTNDEFQ